MDWGQVWMWATTLVTAAAVVAAATPSPRDDSIVALIRKVVDVLALNVGHARNRDAP